MAATLTAADTAERVFDADRLIAQAEATVGCSDWGDTPFRDGLENACRSAIEERLEGPRLLAFSGYIQRLLVKRLKIMQDRRTYPEIARQEIRAPLIVTGLPRSGTTILYALLSQDPAARSPLNWETGDPSPPPRAEHFHDDPRIARATEAMAKLDPTLLAMHTMAANLPEECNMLLEMAFRSVNLGASVCLPSFMRWLIDEADLQPGFDFHRQVLQHLQAFAPKDYWVLKAPTHLHWLDTLFATYPDARVVVKHRDPAKVLPSAASLLTYLRGRTGAVDPLEVGQEVADEWAKATDRLMAFRASGQREAQFIDVRHADFLRAPMNVVQSIYDRFGMALSPDAQAAMTAFVADNQQGKHGKHVYTAEEFGLSEAAVRERFRTYIDTYGIATAAQGL